MKRITAAQVERLAKQAGRHHVDDNLYLDVKARGRPSWLFRYVSPITARRRDMSLGVYPQVTLAFVNERASKWRAVIAEGRDPIDVRDELKAAAKQQEAHKALTLRKAAIDFVEFKRHSWRNDKHAAQWLNSLEHLGALFDQPMLAIESPALFAVLEPLNVHKHETATRIRQRVEAVYNREMLRGAVKHNPAVALRGHLPAPAKKQNFASLPWKDAPGFVKRLRDSDLSQSTRLAFEFLILTASRTSEVIHATWDEVDLDSGVWTISASRMKAAESHDVPLCGRAIEILEAMSVQRGERWNWLFPSPQRRVQPISNNAFLSALDRMGLRGKVTAHGFRSTFSTWAYESSHARSEVIEAALAHRELNAVKAAYSRADYWDQRVELAKSWGQFVA
ncbi:integrase family protein [Oceanococcus atlanticus]|uniref:Integrase family protein n=1 Tax=Oceanococcus atlanticus TaxID=1317117 RepID=A0A1Y1SIP4_9GAMM|nr:tyrosine-type recombinase/integrase [Oceanococcus atlanticus]ORE89270.1 integrase family protein [Oceanococcus atlanticus]